MLLESRQGRKERTLKTQATWRRDDHGIIPVSFTPDPTIVDGLVSFKIAMYLRVYTPSLHPTFLQHNVESVCTNALTEVVRIFRKTFARFRCGDYDEFRPIIMILSI
mmetsp:Transcript_21269/g.49259  ORF Transcript_21269/g.49259 Transcript_21269/m.49259 type:complete len:107 (-) Transcript_21269:314-634(-)